MTRSPSELRSKRVTWSPEEDHKLIAYVSRYGHWNWNYVPQFAGLSRSGKSCRLRWKNYLMPNLKHGDFSIAEEEIIINMQRELGNKWSVIASKLPGRTDNEIKNYWNSRLRKQNRKSSELRVETFKNSPESSRLRKQNRKLSELRVETFKNSPESNDDHITFSSDKTCESPNYSLGSFWLEEMIQMPYLPQLSNPSYDSSSSINQAKSDANSNFTEVAGIENIIDDPFERLIELGRSWEKPFQYASLFDDSDIFQYY